LSPKFLYDVLPGGILVVKADFNIWLHASVIDGGCIGTGEELAGDTTQNTRVGQAVGQNLAIVRR
jgi:hypothetical protein